MQNYFLLLTAAQNLFRFYPLHLILKNQLLKEIRKRKTYSKRRSPIIVYYKLQMKNPYFWRLSKIQEKCSSEQNCVSCTGIFLNKINYNQQQIQLKNWRKLYIILPPSKIHFSIFSSNFYPCTYILSKQLTFF